MKAWVQLLVGEQRPHQLHCVDKIFKKGKKKSWKQLNCPPLEDWFYKLSYIHTNEYYMVYKRTKQLLICWYRKNFKDMCLQSKKRLVPKCTNNICPGLWVPKGRESRWKGIRVEEKLFTVYPFMILDFWTTQVNELFKTTTTKKK